MLKRILFAVPLLITTGLSGLGFITGFDAMVPEPDPNRPFPLGVVIPFYSLFFIMAFFLARWLYADAWKFFNPQPNFPKYRITRVVGINAPVEYMTEILMDVYFVGDSDMFPIYEWEPRYREMTAYELYELEPWSTQDKVLQPTRFSTLSEAQRLINKLDQSKREEAERKANLQLGPVAALDPKTSNWVPCQ